MKKTILLFWLLFLMSPHILRAQYDHAANKVWAMDRNVGLDFRGSSPVLFNTNLHANFSLAHEACAALANANGLIFYTNGTTVWDSTGQVMPNGYRINGLGNNSESATQGALLVPYLSNDTKYYKYYLFSLNSIDLPGRLFCNVINLSLNNGLGDVDTSFYLHQVPIDSSLSEKMVAIKGCNGSIWVLVHQKLNNVFRAYEVNAAGINLTPVVSTCGMNMNGGMFPGIGVLKSSPDGKKLLGCYTAGLEVYDFDKTTGVVSNPLALDSTHLTMFGYYGGDFSPDGSKVYVKEYANYNLWQYDLNAGNPAATRTLLGTVFPALTDIRLAPDQKLYFVAKTGYPAARYLGRINAPNNAGIACGFQDSVLSLAFDTAHVIKGNLCSVTMFPDFNLPLEISFNNNILSTTVSFSTYQWYKAGIIINGATSQTCTATGPGWYSVKVTNTTGCPDSAAYEVTAPGTDVTDLQKLKSSIYIYPNPARDKIWISSPVAVQALLTNAQGSVLIETIHEPSMDIKNIANGIYFLRINDKNGNRIKVEKLIIAHNQ
jgi:hypothetical protein